MKSTGVVRKIDNLGRIVFPIELRRNLKIKEGDPISIYVDGQDIILRKYVPGCEICGELKELRIINGKSICKECAKKIINAWR